MGLADIFALNGKTALITGAGGGIGRALAEAMAEAGADVVSADLDLAAATATAEAVAGLGVRTLALACDVSNEREVEAMVARTLDFAGRLDILFNNAGVSHPPAPLHELSSAQWQRVLAVNLDSVFYCSRAALRAMVAAGSGKIINIASIWGMVGSSSIKPLPAYNASKGAVVNLTRELGLEYARQGINVNAICPGFFATGFAAGAFANVDFVAAVAATTAIGRVGQPRELRGAAIFLASAASDYMCGQTLVVDGGVLAK